MDVRHDAMQLLIHLFTCPGDALGVLRHLQTGGGHTTRIHCLTRSKELLGGDELVHSLGRAAHVGNLCHAQRLVGEDGIGIGTVQFVLGGTRQIDVGLLLPRFPAWEEGGAVELLLVGLAHIVTRGAQFQHILDLLGIQSCGIIDVTVGSADGDHLGTEFRRLLGSAPCHVSETAESDRLALDVKTVLLQHLVHEIEGAVAGSLRTEDRAAPFHTLTGEHTLELMGEFLILSEQITDLTGPHADIACGYILVGTDMTVEFRHEGLTELHHLIIALATDREVRAALAAAHR